MKHDILNSVFADFMRREKRFISDYYTGEKYPVFFRENKAPNRDVDYSRIYYAADTNIKEGSLLILYGQPYLTLNAQQIENTVYHQSDLVRCNAMISTFTNGSEFVVPAYAGALLGAYGNNGNVISLPSGNSEFVTQYNEDTANIDHNTQFIALGNAYSTQSITISNGIMHIYGAIEQHSAAPTYELDLVLEEEYELDTTAFLTAHAKRTDGTETEIVENATLIWESSDENIVSFNEAGEASFVGAGECEIVVIWQEHNLACTGIVRVVAENVKICTITPANGRAEIKQGGRANFTAAFIDDEIADTSIVPIWSFEYPDTRLTGKIEVYNSSGQMIALRAADNATIGAVFNLRVTDSTGEYNGILPITVIPFM